MHHCRENYGTDIQTDHIGSGQKDGNGDYIGGDASMRAHPLEFEVTAAPFDVSLTKKLVLRLGS